MLLESGHLCSSPRECTPPWAHSSALNPTHLCGSGKCPVLVLESRTVAQSLPRQTDSDMLGWRGSLELPTWAPLIIIRLEEVQPGPVSPGA